MYADIKNFWKYRSSIVMSDLAKSVDMVNDSDRVLSVERVDGSFPIVLTRTPRLTAAELQDKMANYRIESLIHNRIEFYE